MNLGVGTLATAKRPADVAIKPLMALLRRAAARGLRALRRPADADLRAAADGRRGVQRRRPQLGADRRRRRLREPAQRRGHRLRARDRAAGRGDAWPSGTTTSATVWPALLREHYGESFSIARRLAGLVTVPRLLPTLGPAGMRSDWLMTLALRWMGNLVTDEDRDRAARVWRWAGRRSIALDHRAAVQLMAGLPKRQRVAAYAVILRDDRILLSRLSPHDHARGALDAARRRARPRRGPARRRGPRGPRGDRAGRRRSARPPGSTPRTCPACGATGAGSTRTRCGSCTTAGCRSTRRSRACVEVDGSTVEAAWQPVADVLDGTVPVAPMVLEALADHRPFRHQRLGGVRPGPPRTTRCC